MIYLFFNDSAPLLIQSKSCNVLGMFVVCPLSRILLKKECSFQEVIHIVPGFSLKNSHRFWKNYALFFLILLDFKCPKHVKHSLFYDYKPISLTIKAPRLVKTLSWRNAYFAGTKNLKTLKTCILFGSCVAPKKLKLNFTFYAGTKSLRSRCTFMVRDRASECFFPFLFPFI